MSEFFLPSQLSVSFSCSGRWSAGRALTRTCSGAGVCKTAATQCQIAAATLPAAAHIPARHGCGRHRAGCRLVDALEHFGYCVGAGVARLVSDINATCCGRAMLQQLRELSAHIPWCSLGRRTCVRGLVCACVPSRFECASACAHARVSVSSGTVCTHVCASTDAWKCTRRLELYSWACFGVHQDSVGHVCHS